MKKIKFNLTQKIIINLTIVLFPLFLVTGLVMQRIFEYQVIRNAETYLEEIAIEETKQINDYMMARKLIGKKSAEFIEKKLTYEPTENDLTNFEKRYQHINGALRTNLKAFDDNDISAIFLSNTTFLDDEIKRIILATEGCFDDYAKGIKGMVFNMYLITNQHLIRIYPRDWSLEIEPDHDFRKDEFYYIGDPQHNTERQSRWTQVYYDPIWKHWMTSLITPVYIKDKFLGIVGHDIILDDIYADVVNERYFNTGYSFIFDSNQNIVIHSNYIDKLLLKGKMNVPLHLTTNKEISNEISTALEQGLSPKQTKVISLKIEGHTNYFLAKKLDFLNWYYGIMLPKNEVLKLLPEFRKKFIYSAIFFCVIIYLTIITLIWRHVLQPIIKISKATEKIGKGNITYKIPCESNDDELGQLAISFNKMTSDLLQRTTSIENLNMEIAERKKAEEKIQNLNNELADAINKLEEANGELKNFACIASHDLREPLRKITMFGTLLKKSLENKLTSDDSENLHFMLDGAQRMNKMIEELLAYSRVSSKTQSTQIVDLNEIVEQLQQIELSVVLQEKQATIEIPQSLPLVEADPVQIRQLMQNLIGNGIKYQKKDNKPHIIITSKFAADGMARIEISDNGIGIKPEYHGAIFVMFKRLHSRSEYEGTGIGLAICKKIAERQGGKIGVESEPDKGSTFWFTIPMANCGSTVLPVTEIL